MSERAVRDLVKLERVPFDFVCMNNDGFDGLRRPRQILMQLVADRGGRVLFVSSALRRFGQRRLMKMLPWGGGARVARNLYWWQPPLLLRRYYHPWLEAACAHVRAALVLALKRWLRLRDPVLFISVPDPDFLRVALMCPRSLVIYNVHDRFLDAQDKWVEGHAEMLRRANLVLCGSKFLLDEVQEAAGSRAYLFPPAVDHSLFESNRSTRRTRPRGARPTIGLVGSMGSQMDWELLLHLAERTEHRFEFVGPIQSGALTNASFKKLKARANVQFRGAVPHDAVPALIESFDACILPYRLNEYTKGVNPLKLLEFLALGKLVVSAPIPAMQDFVDVVRVAATPQEWLLALESVTGLDDPTLVAKRVAFVSGFSYERRLTLLVDLIRAHGTGDQLPSKSAPRSPVSG